MYCTVSLKILLIQEIQAGWRDQTTRHNKLWLPTSLYWKLPRRWGKDFCRHVWGEVERQYMRADLPLYRLRRGETKQWREKPCLWAFSLPLPGHHITIRSSHDEMKYAKLWANMSLLSVKFSGVGNLTYQQKNSRKQAGCKLSWVGGRQKALPPEGFGWPEHPGCPCITLKIIWADWAVLGLSEIAAQIHLQPNKIT